jgi:hypothetical protein
VPNRDGVERLGAESVRERVRWVRAIWWVQMLYFVLMTCRETINHDVTSVPNCSQTCLPTSSMCTI